MKKWIRKNLTSVFALVIVLSSASIVVNDKISESKLRPREWSDTNRSSRYPYQIMLLVGDKLQNLATVYKFKMESNGCISYVTEDHGLTVVCGSFVMKELVPQAPVSAAPAPPAQPPVSVPTPK